MDASIDFLPFALAVSESMRDRTLQRRWIFAAIAAGNAGWRVSSKICRSAPILAEKHVQT